MVYLRRMNVITSDDLRSRLDELLLRVQAGETFEVNHDGRLVARLTGLGGRRRFVPAAEFMRLFGGLPPDADAFRRDVTEDIDHSIRDPYFD